MSYGILWQICYDGVIDMRYINQRVTFLELLKMSPVADKIETREQLYDFYLKLPCPRICKIHLSHHLAPMGDGARVYLRDTQPKGYSCFILYIGIINGLKRWSLTDLGMSSLRCSSMVKF